MLKSLENFLNENPSYTIEDFLIIITKIDEFEEEN